MQSIGIESTYYTYTCFKYSYGCLPSINSVNYTTRRSSFLVQATLLNGPLLWGFLYYRRNYHTELPTSPCMWLYTVCVRTVTAKLVFLFRILVLALELQVYGLYANHL